MLGRKQSAKNADFVEVAKNAQKWPSKARLSQKVSLALDRIKNATEGKNAAYGWSGGKDSIVLADLCQKAGISKGIFGRCNLEYSAFISWVEAHIPEGVLVLNTGYDLPWLAQHPRYLFPRGRDALAWIRLGIHNVQNKYYRNEKLDILCLGRRTIDGNFTGKNGLLCKQNGQVIFSPIHDWAHEDIFAYIAYNNLSLPPIYDWEDGYIDGTHTWNETGKGNDTGDRWRRIYDIEPAIVADAACYFDSAKAFLDTQ